jgi:hypothetical protein
VIVERDPVLILAADHHFGGERLLIKWKALWVERGREFRGGALHQLHPAIRVNPQ